MRNRKLFTTLLCVAVLLVGVALLSRQTNTQTDTSVTTTVQTTNQQLAVYSSIDPPKKKVRVGNTPLFMDANKKVIRTPLKAKSSATNKQTSKVQGKSKLRVIQNQSNK